RSDSLERAAAPPAPSPGGGDGPPGRPHGAPAAEGGGQAKQVTRRGRDRPCLSAWEISGQGKKAAGEALPASRKEMNPGPRPEVAKQTRPGRPSLQAYALPGHGDAPALGLRADGCRFHCIADRCPSLAPLPSEGRG